MSLNPNPQIHQTSAKRRERTEEEKRREEEEETRDEIDALEVFDLLKDINDPEHPLTLEQLNVVQLQLISVDDEADLVSINFTPTIPHCSMATLIGLCLRVKLLRSLPPRFQLHIAVTPGSHASEAQVNRQLSDKERVAAALENSTLLNVVNRCL